jgi:hypothetical protein
MKVWFGGRLHITTTMIELIREKCAVVEHHLKHYWMGKQIWADKNLAQI